MLLYQHQREIGRPGIYANKKELWTRHVCPFHPSVCPHVCSLRSEPNLEVWKLSITQALASFNLVPKRHSSMVLSCQTHGSEFGPPLLISSPTNFLFNVRSYRGIREMMRGCQSSLQVEYHSGTFFCRVGKQWLVLKSKLFFFLINFVRILGSPIWPLADISGKLAASTPGSYHRHLGEAPVAGYREGVKEQEQNTPTTSYPAWLYAKIFVFPDERAYCKRGSRSKSWQSKCIVGDRQ